MHVHSGEFSNFPVIKVPNRSLPSAASLLGAPSPNHYPGKQKIILIVMAGECIGQTWHLVLLHICSMCDQNSCKTSQLDIGLHYCKYSHFETQNLLNPGALSSDPLPIAIFPNPWVLAVNLLSLGGICCSLFLYF